ncbi:uncharacterized protein [Blastocystis hominis]|uniref:Protein root UVB sensitive/RUS domain-containing protein n=1 Tax=Blastocystis hominis TaxID=12968 RepID=D8MBA5_BLAHO|nr:uncharacterized protein [Blastocystis hominis]CBK25344.2 unnamed protein product [Blastocystis hominis]|eukprot:XP_012899392.1 uncharacterized protein [Blastocystis hominis]
MLVSAKGLGTLRFVGRPCFFAKALNSSLGSARLFSQVRDPFPEDDKDNAATSLGISEYYKGKLYTLTFDKESNRIKKESTTSLRNHTLTLPVFIKTTKLKLTDIFLPRNYPSSVKGKYLNYCSWAAFGMGLSAAGGVLSTQSMLFAIGMGAGAVPMAAALNWVLKDGLGQLGGMAFTALVNSRLDADSRGWRILSAWLLEISTWLEVMTPLFPHSFLLLATLANVGKNISWLAGSATRAGIRYGFVNAHNMGDITAKEGSQTVAITVFGTFLGIVISNLIGHGHMEYVLMSSMCISAVSLFSIYQSLRCVSLPTLNYQVGRSSVSRCLLSSSNDQLKAYYHGFLLRKAIKESGVQDVGFNTLIDLVKQTKNEVETGFPLYLEKLVQAGWNSNDLFLEEKSQRYCNCVVC